MTPRSGCVARWVYDLCRTAPDDHQSGGEVLLPLDMAGYAQISRSASLHRETVANTLRRVQRSSNCMNYDAFGFRGSSTLISALKDLKF